jgi:hypothetical protein
MVALARHAFNGSELGQFFMVSRPTVQRIGSELAGVVKNRLLYIERQALAGYLSARWIGTSKTGAQKA